MAQVLKTSQGEYQVDCTELEMSWLLSKGPHNFHCNFEKVPYPEGLVPNNPIIYPPVFEKETVEVTYPERLDENGVVSEESTTETVNVAENYAEGMRMSWCFAYAAYEDLVQSGVSFELAERVLPPAMKQVRYILTDADSFITYSASLDPTHFHGIFEVKELIAALVEAKGE